MNKIRLLLLTILIIFTHTITLYSISDKCKNCSDNVCKEKPKTEKKVDKAAQKDEFEEFTPANSSDEFQSTDEFQEFSQDTAVKKTEVKQASLWQDPIFVKTLIIFLLTILAGVLVRYQWGRNLRGIFLIGVIVWLGFISGACPCMISSLSYLILWPLGFDVSWVKFLWFLGLIPLTYLFGRVCCGWVCHLGALQEILFIPVKVQFLKGKTAQRILKILQYTSLAALIIQLILTRTYLWMEIDPFKVAFNLYSSNLTGYILLGVLIISSLFSYRPFCRGFCPVGLILSWVAKIPGASILTIKSECNGCANCDKSCKFEAIRKDKNVILLDNKECIRCGDCMNTCKKEGFLFSFKKGKQDKIAFFNRER
ncbi:MAG: 4Fe-4S binding protein [bacterium]